MSVGFFGGICMALGALFSGAVGITGSLNTTQLAITGAPVQTQPYAVIQDSNRSNIYFQLDADGKLHLINTVIAPTFQGALNGNADTVTHGIYTTDTGTVTNTMLAGSIANNKLSNSTITFNGIPIALGASGTVTAATPNPLTISTGLQLNSGTTFDGSAARTLSIDSTVATLAGTQALTNKTISGASNTLSNIGNSSLSNSSITINGTSVSLGASGTAPINTTSTTTSASFFPLFVASSSNGNQTVNLGTGLTFNPSTNVLSTTTFSGALNGNATTSTSATTVTTNANLTGVITSSGNATSIASQTGTGTKFVVDTSPTLVTPIIGVAAATSVTFSGANQTALANYEETSGSASPVGAWSPTFTAYFTRFGREVCMTWPDSSTGSAAAAQLVASAFVPSRFRPAATWDAPYCGQNAGVNQCGLAMQVAANGDVVWGSGSFGNFTALSGAAIYKGTACWTIGV